MTFRGREDVCLQCSVMVSHLSGFYTHFTEAPTCVLRGLYEERRDLSIVTREATTGRLSGERAHDVSELGAGPRAGSDTLHWGAFLPRRVVHDISNATTES